MRRADRLFQIVQLLRGGRLTTAAALAKRLEVSERTIYRDIADLIGSGVPIEGEAGVGYVMRAGYDMPPLMFTHGEVAALVAGARMVQTWGGAEMARAAAEALVKIAAVLPGNMQEAAERVPLHAVSALGMEPGEREMLDRLQAACDARLRLDIAYEDGEGRASRRLIRPLGLHFWGRRWTLAAWCELREDFRNFRVDRVRDVTEGARFREERSKNLAAFYAVQTDGH